MTNQDFKNMNLSELTSEDMVSTNGGDSSNYWYALASEAAASLANAANDFISGFAEGFQNGANDGAAK